jgi:TPR repeat protein
MMLAIMAHFATTAPRGNSLNQAASEGELMPLRCFACLVTSSFLSVALWQGIAAAQDENPTTPGAIPNPSTYQGSTELQRQSDQQDQQFRQQQSQPQPSYQTTYPQPRSSVPSTGYAQRRAASPPAPAPRTSAPTFGKESSGDLAADRLNGRGDYVGAVAIWRPLAERGDVNAEYNLGVNYELGHGVPKNDATAAMWYRRAANRGMGPAMLNLAHLIVQNARGPADLVPAYAWSMIAATHAADPGVRASAERNMGVLMQHMSYAQITQAENTARSWAPQAP